jgi:hypothetical protein
MNLDIRVILIYKSTQNRIKSGWNERSLNNITLAGIWLLQYQIGNLSVRYKLRDIIKS